MISQQIGTAVVDFAQIQYFQHGFSFKGFSTHVQIQCELDALFFFKFLFHRYGYFAELENSKVRRDGLREVVQQDWGDR